MSRRVNERKFKSMSRRELLKLTPVVALGAFAIPAVPRRTVTQVAPLKVFYPAEAYHQDYATRHPDNPYIVYNDAPKVANLRQQFPNLYKD